MPIDRRERQAINSANASRQGRNSFWTEARCAALIEKAAARKSSRAIAAEIGEGCTHCMVISKAKRLGVKIAGLNARDGSKKREKIARAEARRQAKIERLRARCAAIIGELIDLQRGPVRVSRETTEAAA